MVRHGGQDTEQAVQVITREGSAREGIDYLGTNVTLHFLPGESQSVPVCLLPGAWANEPRSFEVLLQQPGAGASLGRVTNLEVTIADPPEGNAGAPDTNFVVRLDGPSMPSCPSLTAGCLLQVPLPMLMVKFKPNLALLAQNGLLDPSFTRFLTLDGSIQALALDSKGRLLIGGYFRAVDAFWRPAPVRIRLDGTLDESFSPFENWPTNNSYSVQISTLAVLPDDSILCGAQVPSEDFINDALLKVSVRETGQAPSQTFERAR